jgi:molecular chaperone GrpE
MMGNEEAKIKGGPEPTEGTAQSETQTSSLDDSLRLLRLRRYQSSSSAEPEAEAGSSPLEAEMPHSPPIDGRVGEGENRVRNDGESDEFEAGFDELSREIRRLGREIFRTNRVAERNQEIFDEAVNEIRQLSSTIALIPTQHQEAISSAKFEARAELCRDLLRMSDTLSASLLAADELIARLQSRVDQPLQNGARGLVQGLAFQFSATRQLRDSLAESVTAIRQWRDGQQLLAERLQTILRTAGVREIETAGRLFDPQIHRAVSAAKDTNLPAGTIVGEELRGYLLDGRILRHAEVIVAK